VHDANRARGKPERSGARGLPSKGPPTAATSQTKVKGELEPTPHTRTDPDKAALGLSLLRALPGDDPRRLSRRVVASTNPQRAHTACRLLRRLPPRQRPGRQGTAVTTNPVDVATSLTDQILALITPSQAELEAAS